jgi:hypothetical protein
MVGDDTVMLLRHAAIEAAQAGLDVSQRNLEGVGGKGAGECCIGVSLHDDDCRALPGEFRFETLHQFADLPRPALSADRQHHARRRQAKIFEDGPGHQIVEVLSREDRTGSIAEQVDNARELDDLGPRPEYDSD